MKLKLNHNECVMCAHMLCWVQSAVIYEYLKPCSFMQHIYLKSLPTPLFTLIITAHFPLSVVTTPCHYIYHVILFLVLKLRCMFPPVLQRWNHKYSVPCVSNGPEEH